MKLKFKGKRASINENLVDFLKRQIPPGSTLLDLGCGPKLYSDALRDRCTRVLTVDAWDWVEPDVVANLETTPLNDVTADQWDFILMLDFVEHLDKLAGLKLLEQCKAKANRKVFVLTPLPEIWTDNTEHVDNPKLWCHGNDYDRHKSQWTEADFPGWNTVSIPTLEKYFVAYHGH